MRTPIFVTGLAAVALVTVIVRTAGTSREQRRSPPAAIPERVVVSDVAPLLYHPDPQHLWNRIDRHFRIRAASDGTLHGADAVDPLLWRQTRYLLEGESHATALKLLDEFLATSGERLVADAVRRALLQRDLWAVFDWSVSHFESHAEARRALARRLGPVIRRLGLTPEQLPQVAYTLGKAGPKIVDTYAAAVKSARFPTHYDPADRHRAFLPPDLLMENGFWVPIHGGTPLAQHSDEMSRSWFGAFLKLPGGRAATLAYLRMLWDAPQPFVLDPVGSFGGETRTMIAPALRVLPAGTQVALVRRMLLLDAQGAIQFTNIVESVQIRVFGAAAPLPPHLRGSGSASDQDFFEFVLDRAALVTDPAQALHAVTPSETAFLTFSSKGIDPFERVAVPRPGRPLETCRSCHGEAGLASILSARRLFKPYTFADRSGTAADWSAAFWKTQRADWGYLRAVWEER